MNNTLKINHTVHFSEVDCNYNLRFDSIISTFQKITLYHSNDLKVDAESLLKNSNAFWVLTKMKVKINRLPKITDNITIETWPSTVTPVRFNREFRLGINNDYDVMGSSEWVTLDYTTKTLRRTETIAYPFDMEHRTDVSGAGEFSRKREKVCESDLINKHTVRFVDIDPNNHTNNVAYVRMALNAFTVEEFSNANFKEFEIQYISQTYFGDEIEIYKRKTDYGYYVEGQLKGKTTFICIFKI